MDRSSTSRKLESLPRRRGQRPVVTIYNFRSMVPEISTESATDMFTTALIKSGAFAVAERQQLNEGIMQEKQLNSQGMTTGDAAQRLLAGADYIFEGAITEANPDASKTGLAGTYKGLGVETSGAKGEIGLDIRVLDAKTGLVLDAVNVRKKIKEGGFSVKGIGSFVQGFTKTKLEGSDASIAHDRKEGIDKAIRACIEEAVYALVKRYGE
ncbi:MAG: CsgG/HfaB family protein [Thermodesulfobacteriota bacterium]